MHTASEKKNSYQLNALNVVGIGGARLAREDGRVIARAKNVCSAARRIAVVFTLTNNERIDETH